MSIFKRLLFFIYNLIFIVIAGAAAAAALGRDEPLTFINLALSTADNRVAVGLIATVVLVIAVIMVLTSLKIESQPGSIVVVGGLNGDVSISIPAVKAIIMKAVRKVEGIKEIEPSVSNSPEGIMVYLHLMINPDYSVPEMSRSIQIVVKQYLEEIGGLSVAEVKILVDDFRDNAKRSGHKGA